MTKRINYDAVFCGNLPLHNINLIQPHGFLLILDPQTLEIIQLSENCTEIWEKPVSDIAGTNLGNYISDAQVISEKITTEMAQKIPFPVTIVNGKNKHQDGLALVHLKADYLLLELFVTHAAPGFTDIYQVLNLSIAAIERTSGIDDWSSIITSHLKKISGFDQVLMYQFDEDWNGKVIAECKEPEQVSYLGQQFPASDIPKQARAMYQRNAYRLIPNREYEPVKLYPIINPVTNSFIDLSDCSIRSVAPVHLEYLKNMEVMASMSLRVLREEKLWGLISFHHRSPMYMSFENCALFELLSGFISGKLNQILSKEHFDFSQKLNQQLLHLQKAVYEANNLEEALFNSGTTVADLFNATGAVLIINGRSMAYGNVPPEEFMENLTFWLQNKNKQDVFTEKSLPTHFEEAVPYTDIASGVMSLMIDKDAGNFLILLRPEIQTTINWGGNPDEAVRFEADKKTYHPRNSFMLFKETISQTSSDWLAEEIKVARELRNFLFEYTVKFL